MSPEPGENKDREQEIFHSLYGNKTPENNKKLVLSLCGQLTDYMNDLEKGKGERVDLDELDLRIPDPIDNIMFDFEKEMFGREPSLKRLQKLPTRRERIRDVVGEIRLGIDFLNPEERKAAEGLITRAEFYLGVREKEKKE